MIHKNEAVYLR